MTKNWNLFPNEQPYGEDLANFSCYRLYEKSAIAGYGVLSGCVVSRSSASAVAVASGTFTVAGVKKTFAGGSLTSISAAAAGKHRYDLVYIDGADDTLKLAAGTEDTPTSATDFLENYVPRPAGPTDTDWIVLAVIRVTESGIENTNFGTNSYATGSVANMRLGTPFGVDDTTLEVVDGVASVKSSVFAVAAKGVTNGDSHDHNGGDGAAIVAAATSFSATARVLGRKTASAGAGEECTVTEVLDLLGTAERGDVLYRGASAWAFLPHGTAGQVLTTGGHGADPSWDDAAGGVTFWTEVPGNPARVSDTQFTITDSSNANLYDKVFGPGTIISWEKSGGGWQVAKIVTASYSSNAVTFAILGNTLAAGFSSMKYCTKMAVEDSWSVPGSMPAAALADIGRAIFWQEDRYVFSAKVYYGTGPTTTGGAWDINDDGTTIFSSSKPSIAAGATEGTEVVSDSLSGTNTTAVAAKSKITLDYDSGHATTPGADAYIYIWSMPVGWRYRT